jgi:hypothetical protein
MTLTDKEKLEAVREIVNDRDENVAKKTEKDSIWLIKKIIETLS